MADDTTELIVEQELSETQKIITPEKPIGKQPRFLTLEEIEGRPRQVKLPDVEGRNWAEEFKQNVFALPTVTDTKPDIDSALSVVVNKDNSYDFNLNMGIPDEDIESRSPVSFSEFIEWKYKEARADIYAAGYLREGMYGKMNAQQAVSLGEKSYFQNLPKEHLEVKFAEAPITKLAGETAALMPFILETVQNGVLYGIPLAFIYGAKKALIKARLPIPAQAKFIWSLTDFVAGMKTGMAFSVIKTSIDVEGALIFGDMIKKGVDEDTARILSISAGLMIGLTELAQLSLFSATYRRVFRKIATGEKGIAAIKVALLTALETVGYNPTQEVVQEIIELAVLGLASVIDDNPDVMPKGDGVWNRLLDVWLTTFQGSVFLGILGGIVGGFGQRSRNRKLKREAFTKMVLQAEEKREEDIVVVTKEELPEGVEGEEQLKSVEKLAAAKARAMAAREQEAEKPQLIKVRQEDVREKFERGEIDRREFERRKIDLLGFVNREELVKGIEAVENRDFIPDKALAFILRDPELFSKGLVDFAEKKGIPKGTPAVIQENIDTVVEGVIENNKNVPIVKGIEYRLASKKEWQEILSGGESGQFWSSNPFKYGEGLKTSDKILIVSKGDKEFADFVPSDKKKLDQIISVYEFEEGKLNRIFAAEIKTDEIEKIVEKRKEERRIKERREATQAVVAEQARILRGEEITELTEDQQRVLRIIEREKKKPVEVKIEGRKAFQFKRKDIPARITFLKDQNKAIDKQLDKILTRVSQEKVDANITKLFNDTQILLEQQAQNQKEITELSTVQAKLTVDLGAKKVTLRANEVIALQMNAIKNMIAGIERGKKQGKKIARKQIRELQIGLVNFIKQTEADPAVRAKALAAVARVQTPEQIEKHIVKFEAQVEKAADNALRRLLIDNIKRLTKSSKLRKVSQEFKTQIESILAPFSVVKPTVKTRATLVWAAKELQENKANQITSEEIAILKELDKTPLADINIRNLQLIHDSIAHLIHLNTERQKLNTQNRTEQQEKNLQEAVDNMRDNTEQLDHAISGIDDMYKESETRLFKGFGVLKDMLGAAAWNAELITEILDGKDDGIIMNTLYNEIDEGEGVAKAYNFESEQFLVDAGLRKIVDRSWSETLTKRKSKVKKFDIKLDSGVTLTLRKGTRISFMLLAKNRNSFRQLTEGGFVFARQKHGQATKLTKADLTRIEESATAEEKKVAEIISVYFNSFQKERLNEVFERLFGFSVAVEPEYFPAHVSELARHVSIEEYKGLASRDEFVRNVLEGLGIFKKKRGGTEALVINDAFDVLTDSIRKTSKFIGLAEPLRNAKALFNAPEFKSQMVEAGRGKYLESLKDYLEKIEGSVFNNDNIGKLTQNWQSKIDVAVLGGNLWVFMKQPVSFWLASTEINSIYLAAGMRPVASQTLIDRIIKWSPHLRERFQGNVTLETGEIAGQGATRRLILGKTLMSQKAMIGIHKFDKMAISSIWRAVEIETRVKHKNLKGDAFHQHVAERAWKIIRRTQPTFDMKDRSYVGRTSNTKLRLMTKYTSQRNKNWMIQRRLIERWNRSEGGAKNLAKLMGGLLLVNFIASSMIAGVNALRNLGIKDKKDDIDKEEWADWKKYGVDVIRTILGNTYILGNVLDIALTKIVERKRGFGMTDPISRAFEQAGELLADVGRGIQMTVGDKPRYRKGRVKAEKDRKKLIERTLRTGVDLTSKATGVPFYSTARTLEIISTATGLVEDDEDVKHFRKRRY